MVRCTLVFETSTAHASIVRVAADGTLTRRDFHSDRSHNALLFSPLVDLLTEIEALHIERVLVGSGPGSYSGTRVGIAAAQGVALAAGCPAIAIPSLVALPAADHGAPCLAIGDARRGHFWVARIEGKQLRMAPDLCDAANLQRIIGEALELDVPVLSMDEIARFPLPDELAAQCVRQFPDAARLWQAWEQADEACRHAWAAMPPQPLYLKPPHITIAKRPDWLPPVQRLWSGE